MPDLNLSTVGLVTTLRTAPLNGSPSSSDYNEGQREVLVDLASLAGFINDQILPLINALSDTALLPVDSPVGIEGSTILSDTADQSPIFFDALVGIPLTLADSLRVVNGILALNSQELINLGIEVASLQARLSSTNQNDIALALQNLSASLNSLTVGHIDNSATITALTLRVVAIELADVTFNTQISALDNEFTNLNVPFIGDSGSGGVKGLVPAPPAGSTAAGAFLSANGTFAIPSALGSFNFADGEIPSGAIDGINGIFTLMHPPNPSASLQLFEDGLLLKQGLISNPTVDYTRSGVTITIIIPPPSGTNLEAFYRY